MDELRTKLLARGIVVLPENIDHAAYEYVLEAVLEQPESLVMYCAGQGGSSGDAMAIVDLIAGHGNVTGVLIGEANSMHSVIWAACKRRFVSPNAIIGVHKVAISSHDHVLDSKTAGLIFREYDQTEKAMAGIYAGASDKDQAWWYQTLQDTGAVGVHVMTAAALIALGMARPINEWRGKLDIRVKEAIDEDGEETQNASSLYSPHIGRPGEGNVGRR